MKYLVYLFITFNLLATPSLKEINAEFNHVSQKYNIPAPLLKALAYKQSVWSVNNGKTDELNKGMYGIMGLYQKNRVSSIEYGSFLLNIEPVFALVNYKWNIEASARIISEIRAEYIKSGKNIEKIEDYYSILIDYLDYDESIKVYSENLVVKIYKLINSGYTVKHKTDVLRIAPVFVDVSGFSSDRLNRLYIHYTNINSLDDIQFIYSGNFNYRDESKVDQIIIHIMQGYFEGTITHFKNRASEVSSHYLISREGEIVQMVKLKDNAWHARPNNSRSVGIEHAGFDSNPDFPDMLITEDEYQASAMLTRWLAEKYNIPLIHRDAYHDANGHFVPWELQRPDLRDLPGILGHHDVTGKKLCPGPNWNWDYYMSLLGQSQGNGEIEIINPVDGQLTDNPVRFNSIVSGDIVLVKYFSGVYPLGESNNSNNNFEVEYNFHDIGLREVTAKGYDESNNLISSSIITININIVEAGEGTVNFIQPTDNGNSPNPVVLKSRVTGDVALVKYYADNRFFIGESSDRASDFRAEKIFHETGNRELNARGFNSNGVMITGAEDDIIVNVLELVTCNDECSNVGEKKCNGSSYTLECMVNNDNCKIWGNSTSCGLNRTCESGACVNSCQNECSRAGERTCSGNSVKQCGNYDSDSCLERSVIDTCSNNETCENGYCVNDEPSCSHKCDSIGETKCDSSGMLIQCTINNDNCRVWSSPSSCPGSQICQNDTCVGVCEDNCSVKGKKTCNGNTVDICGHYDDDDCLDIISITTCTNNKVCEDGECVENTTHECGPENLKKCNGNNIDICKKDNEGVLKWQLSSKCEDNLICDNNECVDDCTDKCRFGTKKCNGDNIETCRRDYDSDSCTEWGKIETCDKHGETCESGFCTKTCWDECNELGSNFCGRDGKVYTCLEGEEDDCYTLRDPRECSSGLTCEAGVCINKPDKEENPNSQDASDSCNFSKEKSNSQYLLFIFLFLAFLLKKRKSLE